MLPTVPGSLPYAGGGSINDIRSTSNSDLFEAMIRGVIADIEWLGCGHHIMYKRSSASLPEEISSPDTLIFDHDMARKIWGAEWQSVLTRLALEPAETRDTLLRKLYFGRGG
jgi:hypothetical protein